MPVDFNEILSGYIPTINSIVGSLTVLLAACASIWLIDIGWRFFRRSIDVCTLDGDVVEGAHWGDDGIEYDGLVFEDEGDLSDYVHHPEWSEDDEREYREFCEIDHS